MVIMLPGNNDEARFGHLLQPIRDLTKNWQVDIATQLEDYLTEVQYHELFKCSKINSGNLFVLEENFQSASKNSKRRERYHVKQQYVF